MDYSYVVEEELDRQVAGELGLTLDQYYDYLSDLRNGKAKDISNYRKD